MEKLSPASSLQTLRMYSLYSTFSRSLQVILVWNTHTVLQGLRRYTMTSLEHLRRIAITENPKTEKAFRSGYMGLWKDMNFILFVYYAKIKVFR